MGKKFWGIPGQLMFELKEKYGLRVFVETGTYEGQTTALVAQHFAVVYSIEADQRLYEIARKNVTALNVSLILGDSRKVLKDLLIDIEEPCLIWLDAHWSNDVGYDRPEEGECPLIDELKQVVDGGDAHIVLIDDARFFVSPPPPPHIANQWPTFEELHVLLNRDGWELEHLPDYDVLFSSRRNEV